jgi:hypothetical protein
MFSLRYGKRPVVEESQKISAGVCVRSFLFETKKKYDLNNEVGIKDLIGDMEIGININLKQDNYGKVDYSEPNNIKLTYSKSNLDKGYIFWFICNLCGRRVKYLYFPPNSTILACRNCHSLTYSKQKESKKMRSYRSLLGV